MKAKRIFKRCVTFFLIATLLIGTVSVFDANTTTSYAATRQPGFLVRNVYGKGGAGSATSFGASNSMPAPFNKSHNSMNGLSVHSGSEYRLAYCMGFGLSLHSVDSLTNGSVIYTSQNHGYTWQKMADWKKQYINLALTYGLNDAKASHTASGIQSLIKNNKKLYGVTQTMVWTISHAQDKDTFLKSNYRNKVRNHFLVSGDRSLYDELYTAMDNAYTGQTPSFTKATKANAASNPITLKGNNTETASTVSKKDTTGMLKNGKSNKYSYTEITKITASGSNGAKASQLTAKINRSNGTLDCSVKKGTVPDGKSYKYYIQLTTYYGKYSDFKNLTTSDTPSVVSWQVNGGKGQALAVHTAKIKTVTSYVMVQVGSIINDDKTIPSSLTIKKTASDGVVDGWRFYVRANPTFTSYYNTENGTDYSTSMFYAKEICTDSSGNASIDDLTPGVYEIWEIGYGYAKFNQGTLYTNESESNQTYADKYQSAVLAMYSKTATTSIAYNEDSSKKETLSSKNIGVTNTNFGKYNHGHLYVVVDEDSDGLVTIHNDRITNTLNIAKAYEKDTDDILGYGSQAITQDAVFTLTAAVDKSSLWASLPAALRTKFAINYYYDGSALSTLTIGSDKKAQSEEFNILPKISDIGAAYNISADDAEDQKTHNVVNSTSGKVVETVASQGTKFYSISNNGLISDMSVTGQSFSLSAVNKPDSRYLEIVKKDEKTQETVKRAGFGFEIYDAYTGKKLANSKGDTIFYTDDNGVATFGEYDLDATGHVQNVVKKKVPYGTYIVYEVVAPSPYIKSEKTFYFTVSPNGSELYQDAEPSEEIDKGLVEDTTTSSGELGKSDVINEDVAVGSSFYVKDDEDAEEDELTITDSSGYEEGTATNTTDLDANESYKEEWDASLAEEDSYGDITEAEKILRIVQKNINQYQAVSIKTSSDTAKISFGFENMEQLGSVVVYKTGTTYTKSEKSVTTKETKYGTQYALKNTLTDLSDVEYTIYADGEIQSGTGETLFKDGEVVGIMKTKDGKASFDGLHVGSYILTETATLKGYILPKSSTRFTIDHEGQNVVKEFSFHNELQTMKVEFLKKMEDSATYTDAYKSVIFGLYTRTAILDEEGNVLVPANALMDTATITPEEDYFIGSFEKKLPYGSYYVKEIQTDSRYILDATEYPVEFDFVDYTTEVVNIHVNLDNGGFITNYLKPIGKITPIYSSDTPTEASKTDVKKPTKTTIIKDSVPETGDNAPLGLYWLLLIASSIPMVWMLASKVWERKKFCKKKNPKRMVTAGRKKKRCFFLAFALLFCLVNCTVSSAQEKARETDTITKEKVYKTENFDYVKGMPEDTFDQEVQENGNTYTLDQSDIKYTLKSVIPKYATVTTTYQSSKSGLSEKNYNPAKAVTTTDKYGNKAIVSLQSVSYKSNKTTVTQNVSASTDYGDLVEEPSVEETKVVSVTNKTTGKKENVICSLKNITKSSASWKEDKSSTITIEGYGSSHYRLGDTMLDADNIEDLASCGDVILDYLGLDTSTHKITAVTWNGAAYDRSVDGTTVRCRNATAKIERKVKRYVAKYTGTILTPVTTYTGTAYYSGTNRVQVGKQYEVTATAHYIRKETPTVSPAPTVPVKKVVTEEKSRIPLIVGITVGIVILCLGIVLLIYVLSKRKKQKKGRSAS